MNLRLTTGTLLICIFLTACGPRLAPATPSLPATSTTVSFPPATPDPPVTPTTISIPPDLMEAQFATLGTLQKVDDYPLYTMTYTGAYRPRETVMSYEKLLPATVTSPAWACSLFTVLLDEDHLLYGRNFDWQFSPALLLFTDPPDGYASVSMVDIAYLGFDESNSTAILELSLEERTVLLDAPYLPFDGMNEYGLAIGMAAVPPGNVQPDPSKETIGSLGIIRQMLDHARTVNEAVDIMENYNIDFTGGPAIHYLIADGTGNSVLVEYYNGEMQILENDEPWHLATNFLRSSVDDPAEGGCWRYNKISAQLAEVNGQIDAQGAMQLLAGVAQNNTQWSVMYQMSSGTINVAMGQEYQDVHRFQLDLTGP